jgi:acyl carrier protein
MMTPSLESVITEVKKLLIEVSNLPDLRVETIDSQTSLFADGLGLDSIDVLELVVALDKRFGLKIKNDDKGRAVLANVESIALAIRAKYEANPIAL